MKYVIVIGLILTWGISLLAIHDIWLGTEPQLWQEYVWIGVTLVYTFLSWHYWPDKNRKETGN